MSCIRAELLGSELKNSSGRVCEESKKGEGGGGKRVSNEFKIGSETKEERQVMREGGDKDGEGMEVRCIDVSWEERIVEERVRRGRTESRRWGGREGGKV